MGSNHTTRLAPEDRRAFLDALENPPAPTDKLRAAFGKRASLSSEAEYRIALREASAYFDDEPEPGTPHGERFAALIDMIVEYEAAS